MLGSIILLLTILGLISVIVLLPVVLIGTLE